MWAANAHGCQENPNKSNVQQSLFSGLIVLMGAISWKEILAMLRALAVAGLLLGPVRMLVIDHAERPSEN
jgi:hypothetical protein